MFCKIPKLNSLIAVASGYTEDFDEECVIDFDGDNTQNFGVIKDSVIVIPETCQNNNGQEFTVEDIEAIEPMEDGDDYELETLVPEHVYTFPDKNAIISTNESGEPYRLSDLEVGDVIYIDDTTWMFKIKTITENEDGSISFTQDIGNIVT